MTTRSPNEMTLPEVVIHFGPRAQNYPCSACLNPETGDLTFHFGGYGEPEDIHIQIPVTDVETMIHRMRTEVSLVKVPEHITR